MISICDVDANDKKSSIKIKDRNHWVAKTDYDKNNIRSIYGTNIS
jgi:hypothetical protein